MEGVTPINPYRLGEDLNRKSANVTKFHEGQSSWICSVIPRVLSCEGPSLLSSLTGN
jgi:hypothetical protein